MFDMQSKASIQGKLGTENIILLIFYVVKTVWVLKCIHDKIETFLFTYKK